MSNSPATPKLLEYGGQVKGNIEPHTNSSFLYIYVNGHAIRSGRKPPGTFMAPPSKLKPCTDKSYTLNGRIFTRGIHGEGVAGKVFQGVRVILGSRRYSNRATSSSTGMDSKMEYIAAEVTALDQFTPICNPFDSEQSSESGATTDVSRLHNSFDIAASRVPFFQFPSAAGAGRVTVPNVGEAMMEAVASPSTSVYSSPPGELGFEEGDGRNNNAFHGVHEPHNRFRLSLLPRGGLFCLTIPR